MKQLFYIVSLLTLLCCSGHPGQVKIRGRFAHLEQGEFFIYSTQGGTATLDTLRIQDGEFSYMASLEAPAIMQILYPNYSQLALFVSPGDDIEIKGDAQHLNAVEVTGTEDNEIYTKFRREAEGKAHKEQLALVRQYVLAHPTLAVSRYLFAQYYLLSGSSPGKEVREIYDSLCRACPEDMDLLRLSHAVRAHGMLSPGSVLPDFSLAVHAGRTAGGARRDTVRSRDYRGKYLLMVFWAGWKSGSQSALYRSRRLRREMQGKGRTLNIVSYSLDTDAAYLRDLERRDSVDFPSYCDYKAFSGDLVSWWNIRNLPYFVLVDTTHHIMASGSDWTRDIEPKAKSLCL
ncbi:MAG TPA: hypothetical protein DC006_03700 [Prevotellaceae bacterium]|nr:hypothetical protein [Prevotellaceae bacterium]HBE55553.1 hypothetical protein [Prevotellaceae bacterium]